MIMGDILIMAITLGLGIMIGYNMSHDRDRKNEKLLLSQVDDNVRQQLEVANNLVQSLKKDLAEAKDLNTILKQEIKHVKTHQNN